VIRFSGDIYDPLLGQWLNDKVVFELALDVEAYVNTTTKLQALSFEFSSNPIIQLTHFYSDYIPLDEALGAYLLNLAMPMLVTNLESFELELPSILGIDMNFSEAWVNDTENLGLTMDVSYNP